MQLLLVLKSTGPRMVLHFQPQKPAMTTITAASMTSANYPSKCNAIKNVNQVSKVLNVKIQSIGVIDSLEPSTMQQPTMTHHPHQPATLQVHHTP